MSFFTHIVAPGLPEGTPLGFAAERDNRATGQRRRRLSNKQKTCTTPKTLDPTPKLTPLSLAAMPCSALVDFLIAETSEDAVFIFIGAISFFGITDKEDAIAAMEKDPDARKWAESTALLIPEPYEQKTSANGGPKLRTKSQLGRKAVRVSIPNQLKLS